MTSRNGAPRSSRRRTRRELCWTGRPPSPSRSREEQPAQAAPGRSFAEVLSCLKTNLNQNTRGNTALCCEISVTFIHDKWFFFLIKSVPWLEYCGFLFCCSFLSMLCYHGLDEHSGIMGKKSNLKKKLPLLFVLLKWLWMKTIWFKEILMH